MSGTAAVPEGITNPPIDELLDKVESKYALVIYAAKRARQINAYYSQLGEGLLEYVGPLVEPGPREKPLSIAMREIQSGLLEHDRVHVATQRCFQRRNVIAFDVEPGDKRPGQRRSDAFGIIQSLEDRL